MGVRDSTKPGPVGRVDRGRDSVGERGGDIVAGLLAAGGVRGLRLCGRL